MSNGADKISGGHDNGYGMKPIAKQSCFLMAFIVLVGVYAAVAQTPGASVSDTKTTVEVVSVTVLTSHSIQVVFSAAMQETALDPLNYTVSGEGQGTFSAHPESVSGSSDVYVLSWSCPELMTDGKVIAVTVNPALRSLADLPMSELNYGSDTAMAALPVITLNGDASVSVECAGVYEDQGAVATDACGGDLTAAIVMDSNVNVSVVGVYTVAHNVLDASSNAASEVIRTVNVVDTTAPAITVLDDGSGKGDNPVLPGEGGEVTGAPLISDLSDVPWTPPGSVMRPKVVYGDDDRIDVYAETDPQRLEWAASTCALINLSRMTQQPDGSWVLSSPSAYLRSGLPACSGEPFGDQPVAAFCTGFMVGEDLIATAGHCYSESNLAGVRFVFGYRMLNESTPRLAFSESEVYKGVEVISYVSSGTYDHSIVRVDRPITAPGATPFIPRTGGIIQPGEYVGVIGHPSGLPMKIAFGDTYVRTSIPEGYFVANLDTYGGNSGSPVVNADTGLLEGILVRGAVDFILDYTNNCFYSNVIPPDEGRGEDVTKSTVFVEALRNFEADSWVECGGLYEDGGATAWDNCDGDLTAGIAVVDDVDTSILGPYSVSYNVADTSANAAAEVWRRVYVVDTTPPEQTLGLFDPGRYAADGFLLQEYGVLFSEPNDFSVIDICGGDLGMPQGWEPSPGTVFAGAWLLNDEKQLQWAYFSDIYHVPDARPYDQFTLELGSYLLLYLSEDSNGNIYPALNAFGLPDGLYNVADGTSTFLDGDGNLKPEIDYARLVRVVKTIPMEVSAIGGTHFTRLLGDYVVFEVDVAREIGPLSYQWYRITANKAADLIPGADQPTYTILNIGTADAGSYQCQVYDEGADEHAWSPIFTLNIGEPMPAPGMFGLMLAAIATAVTGVVALKKRQRQGE